ncbi:MULTISPECIES: c-type cytochrome [unclassified Caballeronia]|uniref:c-type cytochrome n=1 Tax=unclassified Caballeronia TaxID=2646786 RepID=UPI002860C82D|nr:MULTISPECIES: c-type cytochrome [unclassified Caballeronia]MDR5784447.1 c-type cytochrome [Caballeronia sp. LZ065]MDR5822409.1 c-type cytochrome [Caballeronia sp. LZ043]
MRQVPVALLLIVALAACNDKPPSSDSITGGNPQRGLEAIQRYGCGACHRIDGVPGAIGKVGPTLQNIGERAYVAGKLPNTPENLQTWIRFPQRLVPGSAMPDLGVSEIDARDIAAYLYHQ